MTKEQYESLTKNDGSWGYSVVQNKMDLWNHLPPAFTNEETIAKIQEWQATGDEELFLSIFYGCLRLVASAVWRLQKKMVNAEDKINPGLEDLFQTAAYRDLPRCIELFDVNKSQKFSTFLYWRIKQRTKNFFNRRKAPPPQVVTSLNKKVNSSWANSGRETEFGDMLSDNLYIADKIHDDIEFENEILKGVLPIINQKDREKLIRYYFDEKSQTEIAQEFGVSQMTISRDLRRIAQNIRRIHENGISAVDKKFFDPDALQAFKESGAVKTFEKGVASQKSYEDGEVEKIIAAYGGLKKFGHDFVPTMKKVGDHQFFKMYYVEKMSVSEIAKACKEPVSETIGTKKNVDEQIVDFSKTRKPLPKQANKDKDFNK